MSEPKFTRVPRDTAPTETILDENDLAEIRGALRAGYGVGLGPNGHVYTNHKLAGDHEPDSQPMTDEQQAYVEERLADVRGLLREGWNVSIKPDGKILANPPGNTHDRYFAGPDRTIDNEEMAWIDSAIRSGHMVHVYPDRSILVVEYEKDAPAASSTVDRDALVRQFHDSLSTLESDLDSGKQIVVSPDGAISTPESTGSVYPLGEEAAPTLRNADALDLEAAQLRAQAEALHEATRTLTKEVDVRMAKFEEAQREVDASRAVATTAQEQSDRAMNDAHNVAANAEKNDAKAAELEAQGRPVDAEEYREIAASLRARQISLTERAEENHRVAVEATAKADELQQQIPDRVEWHQQALPVEGVADQLDEKARLLEDAARSWREAAREEAEGEVGGASGSRNYAKYSLEKADAIKPDYGSLDRQGLREVGVDLSAIPESAWSGREPVRHPEPDPEPQARVESDNVDTAQSFDSDFVGDAPVDQLASADDTVGGEADQPSTGDESVAMDDSSFESQEPTFDAPTDSFDDTSFVAMDSTDFASEGDVDSFDDQADSFSADDALA